MEYQERFILSIQSAVAYGYVGNRAAVFPLQCMGYDVIAVNTVQLSNHTGYGAFKGEFFSPDHIAAVLEGIEDRGVFPRIEGVLSGYLGDATLGQIVLDTVAKIRSLRGDAPFLYTCDPVMGDVGRGFFVRDGIPPFFKDTALPLADIITPNQFELEYLSGHTVKTLEDAKAACDILHERGTKTILVTSLEHSATPKNHIQMMASSIANQDGASQQAAPKRDPKRFIVTTPKIAFDIAPNGSGDCTAALFCGHILDGADIQTALGLTAAGIYTVFEKTAAMNRRELALIQCRSDFAAPTQDFAAIPLCHVQGTSCA